MSEQQKSTAGQPLAAGQMVTATTIHTAPATGTAASVSHVRTVTTSLTTGNVSIRYVPRPAQSGGADTHS